jgi:CheY-like chemotaxis protein
MPGLDGYAVLDAVRHDPELEQTRVIVISARGKERESVFVDSFGVHRAGGLSVGETMRLLRASLDALITPGPSETGQGLSAGPPGIPASPGIR